MRAARLSLWLCPVLCLCLAPLAALAQGRAGAETEADKVVGEADAAFEAGNYADAAPLYDRALALDPTRTAVLVKRATLYFRERRYDRAIELLGRAERQSPDDLNVKTVLGLCLYQSDQKERGLRYLTEVAARRPEAYEAQLQIGQHYARTDPDRAITALNAYFTYRPEEQRALDGPARLYLGTAHLLLGHLPEADDNLTRALAARRKDPQTQLTLGAVALLRGDFARAVQLHEPFVAEIPRRPRVAFNLAQGYLHLGRRTEAARLATQYVGLRPADPRGHVLLGDVALFSAAGASKEPDPRGAVRHYEDAARLLQRQADKDAGERDIPAVSVDARIARAYLIAHDPDRAIALAELALHRADAGKLPGGAAAQEELTALLLEAELGQVAAGLPASPQLLELSGRLAQLLPGDAAALALAGSGALAAGNLERARELYREALSHDARLPRARAGMARTLQRLAIAAEERDGGAQAAVALLEQALPYDDTTSTARNLAVAYLIQGQADRAQKVLAPALAGRPDMGLLRLQARILLAQGKPGPALEAYERAAAEASQRPGTPLQDAELRAELGARYLAAGRFDDAVESLERALRDLGPARPADPDTPEARQEAATRRVVLRDVSLAYLARGRAALREQEALLRQNPQAPGKLAEQALEDLQKAVERGGLLPGRRETGTALCAAALAAVQSAKYHLGRELCARAQAEGGCDLAPPYDRLGMDLLLSYISYRDTMNTTQREKAVKSLGRLQSKVGAAAGGQPLQNLLRALLRSTHEMLAYDYYATGKAPKAAQLLRAAQRIPPSGDTDTDAVLAHNLAVLELQDGKGGGERTLERLNGRPPEALVNLGILHDRRGEPKKALELYRQGLQRGARTPKLREWIDVKDRILGEGP